MALPQPSPTTAALVTGASSGIGVDLARQLAQRGHNVVLVARREDRLQAVAAELRGLGVRAEVLACDLIDPEATDALPGRVEALGLEVSILINNAGYGSAGQFSDLDVTSEAEMVRLNCEAIVRLSGAYVPRLIARDGGGAILVVASSAGMQPIPGQATYAASKAFALSFAEALHTELSHLGVAVSALCPGPIDTEFAARAGLTEVFDGVPDFVRVSPEDCARIALDGLARNKRVVVPGLAIKGVTISGRLTPRAVLLPLMKRFYPA